MDTPICSSCTQPQKGIVEFRWSEGAVVYECSHCGAFNEVSEVRRLRGRNPYHLHVKMLPGRAVSSVNSLTSTISRPR